MDRIKIALIAALASGAGGAAFDGIAAEPQRPPVGGSASASKGAVLAGASVKSAESPSGAPIADDQASAQIGPSMTLVVGKSTLLRLPAPIERISLGNPAVADVTMISSKELYLLGKTFGSTNIIMWRKGGATTIVDVSVGMDALALEQRLRALFPEENDVKVNTAADSIVLSGNVSSALKADYIVSVAETFARNYSRGISLPVTAGNAPVASGSQITVGQAVPMAGAGGLEAARPRVINTMRVAQPQQVMLEVRVAEISKNLLDKLGVGLDGARVSGDWRYSILSGFLSGSAGVLGMVSRTGNSISLDAEKKDGLIKVLAEPSIVAISGQEASFLAGGRVFIPVSRANSLTGLAAVTLEEKEFGVGLKFTPTVLDGGRINLKVAPEVSELSQVGQAFSTVNGQTSVLPSMTMRRAQTTVQLMDGQSIAIAGLIKNNVSETLRRFPVLGEIPILGALFRSSEFQTDRSELMFVITPRLVKPLPATYSLPTDSFVPPSRTEFFVHGQLEGTSASQPAAGAAQEPSAAASATSPSSSNSPDAAGQGGFRLK